MENVTLKSTYKFDDKFRAYSAKLYDIVQHLKTIRLGLVDNYSCNDDEKFAAKVLFEEALMELKADEQDYPAIVEYYSVADAICIDLIEIEKGSEITNLTIDLLDHWHKIKRSTNVWSDSSLYTKKLEEFKRKSTEKEQRELEEARQQLNNLAQQINQQHGGQPQQQTTAQAGAGYPPFTTGDVFNSTSPNIFRQCRIPASHTLAAVNDAITMTPHPEAKVSVYSSDDPMNIREYGVSKLININTPYIPTMIHNWHSINPYIQEGLKLPLCVIMEELWQSKPNNEKFQIINAGYNNLVIESEKQQIQIVWQGGRFEITKVEAIPKTSTTQEEPEKTAESKTTETTEMKEPETKTSKTKTTKAKKTPKAKTTKAATETKEPETKETETKESETAN